MEEKKHDVRFLTGQGYIIEIDGIRYKPGKKKYYQKDGCRHIKYQEFEQMDLDEHNTVLKELGKQLRNTIPPERVIEESFKNHSTKDIKKLLTKLKSGDVVAKRHDGCLGITLKNTKKKKAIYHQILS